MVDKINRLYGKNALYFASAHQALDHAPMRIAFNRIPDIETER
jgi:DNA polymerase-4